MLTGEEWTRGTGTPPAVKGFAWYTDGFRTQGETRAESMSNLQEEDSIAL